MQTAPIPRWVPFSLSVILVLALAGFFFRSRLVEALGWNQLQKTQACLQSPVNHELAVQPQMTRLVLGKKINTILVSGSQVCVQKGHTVRLMPRLSTRQWVLRKRIATAQILSVRHTSWNKIDKKMAQVLGYSNINALKRDLLGQFGPATASQPLALAQFQILSNDYINSRSRVIPYETPYARALNRQWTHHLISKGVPLYDVRPRDHFKEERIPRALSVPYHFGKYPKDIIYARFDKLLSLGDSINLELFPKDKNAPFIIYGQNPTDVAALRALAIVHRYGWKKVYWFWGGMDAWANRPIIPPATDPRVQLMTAEKLQKALPIGAHIVDVRTAADFKRGRIPNARHIDIQWRPPTPGQTSSTFHMKMDELPSQRNALLVFYGEDDLAWEPYQAALWAKANGWQNVFWLRGGFSQWRAAGEIFRNRYRSVRSKK